MFIPPRPPKIVLIVRPRRNTTEADRPHDILWRPHFVCRITKARKSSHYEYLRVIAVLRQQLLREGAIILRRTYIVSHL
jgi:hypothetical protein